MPNLFDALLERMEGRKYSNYFSAFCPFDRHKAPALLVYDDGMFVCLSCGKKGSLKYLDKVTGSHFIPQRNDTVSQVLPRWRKWEEKYDDLEGIVQAAHRNLKRYPKFQVYFKKRKIEEFIDEGVLGYLDGWICFPVFETSGKIVDIVVRSSTNRDDIRYVISPIGIHSHTFLYIPSWETVNAAQTVYVVYGIIDAISLHLVGLPVVTGVTGKSLSPDLLKPLGKRFIIVPDMGEETEAYKLANKLGWRARVKEVAYPQDTKDTDDIRRQFGNEYLLQALGA
jgi:DNA primase